MHAPHLSKYRLLANGFESMCAPWLPLIFEHQGHGFEDFVSITSQKNVMDLNHLFHF
jgi:hypothetical protein